MATLATPTIRSIKCKQSPVYGVFWPLLPHPSTDRNETRTWSSLFFGNFSHKIWYNYKSVHNLVTDRQTHKPTPVKNTPSLSRGENDLHLSRLYTLAGCVKVFPTQKETDTYLCVYAAVCPVGFHGINCSDHCGRCKRNVTSGQQCFRNGTCIAGCQPGWTADDCTTGMNHSTTLYCTVMPFSL